MDPSDYEEIQRDQSDVKTSAFTSWIDDCLFGKDKGIAAYYASVYDNCIKITDINGSGYRYSEKKKLWEKTGASQNQCSLSDVLSREFKDLLKKNRSQLDKATPSHDVVKITARIKQLEILLDQINVYAKMSGVFRHVVNLIVNSDFEDVINMQRKHHLPIRDGKLVDLQSGKIRDRTRCDLFSFECPVDLLPIDHPCSYATRFFDQVFINDKELIGFAQELFGYFLTGYVSDRSFYFLWGTGHNGKSTLMELMDMILKDYYGACSTQLFLKQTHKASANAATPALLVLKGRRLCAAMETSSEEQLDEPTIKQLTGRDPIAARGLYKEIIKFVCYAKLVMLTNEPPSWDIQSEAMMERIKLLPFLASFVLPEKKDPKNPRHFDRDESFIEDLKGNLSEVFTLLVRGAMRWFANGKRLKLPDICQRELDKHNANCDHVGRFIEEKCEVKPEMYSVATADLHRAFVNWCQSEGIHNILSPQKIGAAMKAKGFEVKRRTVNKYIGIILK